MKLDIPYLLKNLTLEEKAGLCSGADSWFTKAVDRLGLPAVMVSDGPHGLRTQKEKKNGKYVGSVKAVCFPAGCALSSSYDTSLMEEVGRALGEEAASEGVHTLLGPAVNIKRSPLCGRNFEYLGEDPYQVGVMASSYVKGVQSRQTGVSLKHFAANSQEHRRMSIDEHIDERTLREIYLAAFERVVREAKPWTLMCSYNRINGKYSSDNAWLLDEVLRREWGFDGIVMSDWGAVNRRCDALRAGLELEMPSSGGMNDALIVRAVKDGSLSAETLDRAVFRLLGWINKGLERKEGEPYDKDEHNALSRRASAESAVLLKNENSLLPFASLSDVLFVGPFAKNPRYQGGGSSHINSSRVTGALDAAPSVAFRSGIADDGESRDGERLRDALEAASKAGSVVVFAGLPETWESEGYDRTTLSLPPCQNELIEKIAAVNKRTVVVLHNGSPVTMPWKDDVAAILEMYLGGQAVGGATVDLLTGALSPSGKLAETFPLSLEDTPCHLDYDRDLHDAYYGERFFVGYRGYDEMKKDVLFPFGYGLSYTSFALSSLRLSSPVYRKGGSLTATVRVENTGSRDGAEVVQLYIERAENLSVAMPPRQLKGFRKVFLKKGEAKEVSFSLGERSFAYWDVGRKGWRAEKGVWHVAVGTSSRNLTLSSPVTVEEEPRKVVVTDSTTVADVLSCGWDYPEFRRLYEKMRASSVGDDDASLGDSGAQMHLEMLKGMPLHAIPSFVGISYEEILAMLR